MMLAQAPSVSVNARTNRAFFARHPERGGRPILRDEPGLVREWFAIRAQLAREAPSEPQYINAAMAPGSTPCRVEDPFPPSLHKPGVPCAPDGRKCWPSEGWVDLVDADMPCNDETRRHPAAYAAILDYFNVAHPGNARYARTPKDTFCNIYVHDVTRAMRASIPHWIRDPAQTAHKPVGWRELGANATFDWINAVGRNAGWFPIDRAMIDWILRQQAAPQSLPFAGGVLPAGIATAGARIAAQPHPNAALLQQDAYVAQQFANQGLPTAITWKNPGQGAGHVGMVRPEHPSARGVVVSGGRFAPLSAQAGAENYESRPAMWISWRGFEKRQFWVHT